MNCSKKSLANPATRNDISLAVRILCCDKDKHILRFTCKVCGGLGLMFVFVSRFVCRQRTWAQRKGILDFVAHCRICLDIYMYIFVKHAVCAMYQPKGSITVATTLQVGEMNDTTAYHKRTSWINSVVVVGLYLYVYLKNIYTMSE